MVPYDRRGYERSRQCPPATGLTDHVADLLALVGQGPGVVVGHSFGGDIAIAGALSSPAIRAVAAYEPPMPWLDWWPRRSAATLDGADPALYAESFFRRMVGDEAWDRLPDHVRAARQADGPALLTELMAIRNVDAPFDISALEVPAVLGRGGLSVEHHRRAVEMLAKLASHSEVVEIPGAAHGAHLTHPDAFAAMVKRTVELSLA